jgi:hypothetical protein
MTLTSAINIIPGQSGTYRHLQRRVTDLLADSGLSRGLALDDQHAHAPDATCR